MLLLFLLLLSAGIPEEAAGNCFNAKPKWTTSNGNILINGNNVYHLKGTNWFGFETDTKAPHGLWALPLSHFLDFLSKNNFNTLRLPFSVEFALSNPSGPTVDCGANPGICHNNYLDLMETVVDKCAEKGIMVMLDQHRLYGDNIHGMWFDNRYSEQKVLESWDVMLGRFGGKWNVMALDLKNEPHNEASWGKGRSTDWNKAAERIIKHIATAHPDYQGLFFVEGVQEEAATTTPNNYDHWWGGNMEGVHTFPISTGNNALDARVVYSPHVYGPDVFARPYFQTTDFPRNMPAIWDLHFGFVEKATGRPIVLGEWGGHFGGRDKVWQDALADYLIQGCMSDQFYWCLNPNSGDTGGLLDDDWKTGNRAKLQLLAKVQPNPSKLIKKNNQYCFTSGNFANSACSKSTNETTSPPVRSTRLPSTKLPSGNTAELTVSASKTGSWNENGQQVSQVQLAIKNSGSRAICGAVLKSTRTVKKQWNLNSDGSLPSWFRINPRETKTDVGMIVIGKVLPKYTVSSIKYC